MNYGGLRGGGKDTAIWKRNFNLMLGKVSMQMVSVKQIMKDVITLKSFFFLINFLCVCVQQRGHLGPATLPLVPQPQMKANESTDTRGFEGFVFIQNTVHESRFRPSSQFVIIY